MSLTGRGVAVVVFALLCTNASAVSTTLFDAVPGTLPSQQGALFFCSGGISVLCRGGDGTQTVSAAGVDLDTTPLGDVGQAGYTDILPALVLDRTQGIGLNFDLAVNSESHANNDRAGFSVILITADLKGIEIGFWADEIWPQDSGFLHGNGAAFPAMNAMTSYSLRILGAGFSLLANNAPLFSGALHDYSAKGLPYDIPNFLFFGDNTTRAQAELTLGSITVETGVVPVPASFVLLVPAVLGLAGCRRS